MQVIYLIAITAEAASGAIMGMRRRMDLFGVCVVGTVTALGGGTIRDVLLGRHPLGWVAHPEYLFFTVGAALAAACLVRFMHQVRMAFLVLDALGLVAFAVIGCDIAAATDAHPSIVVLMGMVTGICGGLLRDVLCNQVPLVLRRDLYASVALATGALYVLLQRYGVAHDHATWIALLVGFLFRLVAIRKGWALPVFTARRQLED
ncbi:trimeric intracellular cation channel family protein [Pigmentiphaga humi]|uniref:trimeric intracellular cation channel family protein n=1 Tax=Pigmentiphaga humi TaxID=2478468 RepID=UPI001CA45A82|nr:trimeric intracellular cation channel family protein [Pigmentiphaga humi]